MIKRAKELLIGTNIPMIAFGLYVLKVVLLSPSYPDAIVLAILSGIYGYNMKMKLLAPQKPGDKLQGEINEIKSALSKVNLANIGTPPRRF